MVRSLLRFRATYLKKLRLVLLVTEGMPIRSVQGGLNHAATKSHQDYLGDLIIAVAKPPCRLPSLKSAMFFRVLRFLTSKADISAPVSIRARTRLSTSQITIFCGLLGVGIVTSRPSDALDSSVAPAATLGNAKCPANFVKSMANFLPPRAGPRREKAPFTGLTFDST